MIDTMSEALTITEVRISDFMRLEFVEVTLKPGVNPITGDNANGKTSFMLAIEADLGGERHCPEQPVRRGARSGEVEVTIAERATGNPKYKATKTWDNKSKPTFRLEDADGNRIKERPQERLNAIIGELTFDPLDFMTMEPKKQAEILRRLTGLSFDDLNAEYTKLFAERTALNKSIAQAEGQLVGLTRHADVPAEEVSVQEVAEQLNAAHATKAANDKKRRTAVDAENAYRRADDAVADAEAEIERLERELENARVVAENAKVTMRESLRIKQESKRIADALVDPDTTVIQAQLAQVDAVNRKIRANAEHAKLATRLDVLKKDARGLTKQLEGIEVKKTARLEAAQEKMPVPGLSLDGDEILLNDIPLIQASSAQKLTLCLEIGAALNPTLRTIFVHNGEKLGRKSRLVLAEWATKRGMQIVMEIRTDGEPGWGGVTIENGRARLDDGPEDAEPHP